MRVTFCMLSNMFEACAVLWVCVELKHFIANHTGSKRHLAGMNDDKCFNCDSVPTKNIMT